MAITDAQVHIWNPESMDRPWPKDGNRAAPHLAEGLTAERMIASMDAAGVDRAVIVPPSWVGEDNSEGLAASAKYPSRYAVMGRFDPTAEDARGRLASWLEQPRMLGIRMTLFRGFAAWLEDGTLDWFWADCERLGIPVMALTPGTAAKLDPVAAQHPGLTLIVDHAANLSARASSFATIDQLVVWVPPFVKVARRLVLERAVPFADIKRYLRRITRLSAQRLMGAHFNRLSSTYRVLEHFRPASTSSMIRSDPGRTSLRHCAGGDIVAVTSERINVRSTGCWIRPISLHGRDCRPPYAANDLLSLDADNGSKDISPQPTGT
jgi:L-fuconolactonase